MATLINDVGSIQAAASIDGGAVPVYFRQVGFTGSIVRNGAGDYTLTLNEGINLQTEASVIAGIGGNGPGMIAVEAVSTVSMRVRTLNAAGAAADLDFWVRVERVAVG